MSKIISDTIQGRSKDPNVNAGLTIAGVTTATGVINASSDVRITGNLNAGIVTVTSISGNGAGLSNVGVDTATVDASTLQVSGISTFKNELKVTGGGIEVDAGGLDVAGVGTFAGVVNASSDVRVTGNLNAGITTTSSLVNGTALSHRNLIINGAMEVAQRGTSNGSVTSSGYYACDRWRVGAGGLDSALTVAQSALASSDTPYSSGFRYATKITNGDQSGGLGATDYVSFAQRVEGQNINSCGWDFTSASSNLTVSFWIKSSVAQTFYSRFRVTEASANKEYVFAVAATTSWQKITQTIPGASGLNPKNNNDMGFFWDIILAYGTDYTGSMTLDQWNTVNTSAYTPDMTSTWYTTNGATFEITGVQLEVGPVVTPFEFRSYGEELLLCQRYYQQIAGNTDNVCIGPGRSSGTTTGIFSIPLSVPLRASPTVNSIDWAFFTATNQTNLTATPTVDKWDAVSPVLTCYVSGLSGMTNARCLSAFSNSANTFTINSEM